MEIMPETPIGKIATELEGAIELFEDKKLNYYFGGHRSLQDACLRADVCLEEVLSSLRKLSLLEYKDRNPDWDDRTLVEMINYIVRRHHVFIRHRLEFFCKRSSDLAKSGKPQNPIFLQINSLILEMSKQMEAHMKYEEETVFPYLKEMETRRKSGLESSGGKYIKASVAWRHESMWDKWSLIRMYTNDFRPRDCSDQDLLFLCESLREFEEYIHQHGHMEDNILFRKAAEMRFFD